MNDLRISPAGSSATSSTQPSARVDSIPTLRLDRLGSDRIEETLKQRGNRYGTFADNASVTQHIMAALHGGSSWDSTSDAQREALHMIAHKLARIVCGDPNYDDSWHDLAGYASLIVKILRGEEV